MFYQFWLKLAIQSQQKVWVPWVNDSLVELLMDFSLREGDEKKSSASKNLNKELVEMNWTITLSEWEVNDTEKTIIRDFEKIWSPLQPTAVEDSL